MLQICVSNHLAQVSASVILKDVTTVCQAHAAPAHRANSWTTNRPAGQPTKSQLFIQAASHPARELDESGHSKSLLSIWRAICQLANSTRQAGKPDARSTMHPTRPPPCLPATHPANHSADQPACHQARAQSCPFSSSFVICSISSPGFVFRNFFAEGLRNFFGAPKLVPKR